MRVDGLLIPDLLLGALEAGHWPKTSGDEIRQNLRSLVPPERVQALAPDESRIYLYPPPFHTVASDLRRGVKFSQTFLPKFGRLDQIVPEAAIVIADFGLGSDSPVLLDYQESVENPRVIRLYWPGNGLPNEWKVMAPDFARFMRAFGLCDA